MMVLGRMMKKVVVIAMAGMLSSDSGGDNGYDGDAGGCGRCHGD